MKKIFILFIGFFLFCQNILAQGLKFNNEAYKKTPQKFSKLQAHFSKLPTKVDLSKYVPSVLDQGQYGTCVGVSTAYYMRTILEAKKRKLTNLDSINAISFSPSYVYNAIKDSDDKECFNGTEIVKALEFMKNNGVVTYNQQGYPQCNNENDIKPAPNSKIVDYIKLFGLIDRTENIILSTKKVLAEESPVIVGIQTTPSLDALNFWESLWWRILHFFGIDSEMDISLWKPSDSNSLRGGHAVCVIGYDDKKFGGAFKVVNSRGEYWGDNGFFWIRYKDYVKHAKYGFQAYLEEGSDIENEISAEISFSKATFTVENELKFIANFDTPASLSNKEVVYSLTDKLPTNSDFKCSINIEKQCYLYVLAYSSADNEVGKLFPRADSISAIIGQNTNVLLPSEDSLFRVEGTPGTEYLLFLLSKTPINKLDDYINEMNNSGGSFYKRAKAVFGEALIPYNELDFQRKKMKVSLKGKKKGNIIPILISIDHIAETPNQRI